MRREAARLAEENGSLQRALLAAAEAAQAADQERARQVRATERRSQEQLARAARNAAAAAALEAERDALRERVRELLGMGRHCSQGEGCGLAVNAADVCASSKKLTLLSCRGLQRGWTAPRSRRPGSQPAPPWVGCMHRPVACKPCGVAGLSLKPRKALPCSSCRAQAVPRCGGPRRGGGPRAVAAAGRRGAGAEPGGGVPAEGRGDPEAAGAAAGRRGALRPCQRGCHTVLLAARVHP